MTSSPCNDVAGLGYIF